MKRIYIAFMISIFTVPAIAAPASAVSVTVNPTTGYFESTASTVRVPPGVKFSPVKDVSAVVVEKLPGGGLSQSISSGIEITALKQSAPVQGRFVAGVNAVRGAAVRCVTSMRCNLAFSAGAAGLQSLLDGVGWIMDEGGRVRKISGASFDTIPADYGYRGEPSYRSSWLCSWLAGNPQINSEGVAWCVGNGQARCYDNRATPLISGGPSGCYYASSPDYQFPQTDVSESELVDVFSGYTPDPSDLRWMTPGFDLGHDDVGFEITSSPSLKVPPKTTTIYDADGNPIEIQETNIWHDFSPTDNPSKQPGLDQKTTEETNTYDRDGNKTGSSSTTTNNNSSNTSTNESTESLDWLKGGEATPVEKCTSEECGFKEREFFGGEDVPSFSASFKFIHDGIKSSPIGLSLSNISFPSGGTCPTGSIAFDVMGYTFNLVFESHCSIWEVIAPFISASFLALWALLAVRVFLSA